MPIFFLVATATYAQYVPPVPKSVIGGRALHRKTEIPLPSDKQQWVRARSAHFLTLSGASERRTSDVLDKLETVAVALRQIDPHFAAEGDLTHLILFARTRDGEPYFDLLVGRPKTPGAFVVNGEGVGTMLVDGSRVQPDRTIFHELVHNLLANSGTHVPLWLEEGIADYFSTADILNGVVRFGTRVNEHDFAMHTRRLMPIDDLFKVDAASNISGSAYFYAESWSVVDWLMRANSAAFFRFVNDVDDGMSSVDALTAEYHTTTLLIERSIEIAQVRPPARFTIHIPPATNAITTEPIGHDEAVVELASFLGLFGATRRDAERFLKSVPQNAHALASLAALRTQDKKYDEATQLYERALTIAPNNVDIKLQFAESLLGNALGPFSGTTEIDANEAPRFRRARQLANEALAGGGDASRANAVIGTSYLLEDDVRPGIEPLQRAREARPNRYDIELSLYALLLRAGDTDAADKLYDEISSRARTPQAIFAARSVYVREQLALVNRFIHENRIDAALPVMAKVIERTPDPKAKMDLQQQMMKMRETAEINKQILTYNKATDLANHGEAKKALEIINQLLETATDAGVIKDSMALKKILEKRVKGMRRS